MTTLTTLGIALFLHLTASNQSVGFNIDGLLTARQSCYFDVILPSMSGMLTWTSKNYPPLTVRTVNYRRKLSLVKNKGWRCEVILALVKSVPPNLAGILSTGGLFYFPISIGITKWENYVICDSNKIITGFITTRKVRPDTIFSHVDKYLSLRTHDKFRPNVFVVVPQNDSYTEQEQPLLKILHARYE